LRPNPRANFLLHGEEVILATIIILLGSILGFGTAAVSYLFLDGSLLLSLAIWGGSGPVSAILAALLTWSPADQEDDATRPSLAEIA
jgi:hypothetical protein